MHTTLYYRSRFHVLNVYQCMEGWQPYFFFVLEFVKDIGFLYKAYSSCVIGTDMLACLYYRGCKSFTHNKRTSIHRS